MPSRIKTLWLVPHSHTDLGYTHDPVVAWELHDRFLDQAIRRCEETAAYPDEARFRWTIEVFATLERWWSRRDETWRRRLLALMREGRVDVGARRFNGTFLQSPGDIRWELERAAAFGAEHALKLRTAFNNDVNGFALAYAQEMARRGMDGLVMGLNTTMGISPYPRPCAWRWKMPGGETVLVWNGWIYNRLKSFVDVERLAQDFPAKLPAFFAGLPADYPFDFAMANAVVDDNTGPILSLPDQVRRFNEGAHGIRLRITTVSGFMDILRAHAEQLPERAGDWVDAWSFYLGSFPQEVAAVRRAQRRLDLVEGLRRLGWANEEGGSLTLDRAREEISLACEHTYGSHDSCRVPGSADSQRQWVQIRASFWNADGISMSLLRDHLAAAAPSAPTGGPSVAFFNPSDEPMVARAHFEPKGLKRFADASRPEHLLQFDREPTRDAFAASAKVGVARVEVPARSRVVAPICPLDFPRGASALPEAEKAILENGVLRVVIDPARLGAISLVTKANGTEWLHPDPLFAAFAPVRERLVHPASFQATVPEEVRDPSDVSWSRDHRFEANLLGRCSRAERARDARGEAVVLHLEGGPVRELEFRLDPLRPDALELRARGWLDADCSRQALYFAFDLALAPPRFFYDSCGLWIEAGKPREQLPGSATSHYAAWRGVAIEGGGGHVCLASRDTVLWQFGGFTFGHPQAIHERHRAFVAAWWYNNYWFCNVPPCSPGGFELAYQLRPASGPFDPRGMERLHLAFLADDAVHPVGVRTPISS